MKNCAYEDHAKREIKTFNFWGERAEPTCECGFFMIGTSQQTGISYACGDPQCTLPTVFVKNEEV